MKNDLHKEALDKLKGNEKDEYIVSDVMRMLSEVSASYRDTDLEKCIEVREELLHIGYNCDWSTGQAGGMQIYTEFLFNFLIYLKRYERALYWIDKCLSMLMNDNEKMANEFIKKHPRAKEKVLNGLEANEEIMYGDYKMYQHDVKELIEKREIVMRYINTQNKEPNNE